MSLASERLPTCVDLIQCLSRIAPFGLCGISALERLGVKLLGDGKLDSEILSRVLFGGT